MLLFLYFLQYDHLEIMLTHNHTLVRHEKIPWKSLNAIDCPSNVGTFSYNLKGKYGQNRNLLFHVDNKPLQTRKQSFFEWVYHQFVPTSPAIMVCDIVVA